MMAEFNSNLVNLYLGVFSYDDWNTDESDEYSGELAIGDYIGAVLFTMPDSNEFHLIGKLVVSEDTGLPVFYGCVSDINGTVDGTFDDPQYYDLHSLYLDGFSFYKETGDDSLDRKIEAIEKAL